MLDARVNVSLGDSTQRSLLPNMITPKALLFWLKFLVRSLSNELSLPRKISYPHEFQSKLRKYSLSACEYDGQSEKTLIFHLEGALLKSDSLFQYFLLVAFEAGGLVRALALFLSYPFICVFSAEVEIKMMVFICFFAMKKENLLIKRSVLPKFFLEDVGREGYEMVIRYRGKVAVSNLPTVMVEGFLEDYLAVDAVIGRDLKEAFGYFVGLMEENRNGATMLNEILEQNEKSCVIGFGCINKPLNQPLNQQIFSHCQEIYLASAAEKRKWRILPREKYPKPLIFHDGRLAFRPTYFATLAMLMWLPFGVFWCIVRLIVALLLPYEISIPILAFTGMRAIVSGTKSVSLVKSEAKTQGTVYVCNHRTLLDPIYISMALMKSVSVVTYSISRVSELLSPLKTGRLTRDKQEDAKMLKVLLRNRDVVVFPEGTTCREPYLLRFSPLFAEVSDDIVLVALDVHVSMFYGTTASGLKCLDPLFFMLNPYPTYAIKFLERLPESCTCSGGGKSRFEVANYVQAKIANALGFECTLLTRKDKYMILAGNEGIAKN